MLTARLVWQGVGVGGGWSLSATGEFDVDAAVAVVQVDVGVGSLRLPMRSGMLIRRPRPGWIRLPVRWFRWWRWLGVMAAGLWWLFIMWG